MELIIQKGTDCGTRYYIRQGITHIGRSHQNEIQIFDDQVSRSHCEIRAQDGTWVLKDLDSRNGTYVNGRRVEEAILKPKDEIKVGNTNLLVSDAPPPREAGIPDVAQEQIRIEPSEHGMNNIVRVRPEDLRFLDENRLPDDPAGLRKAHQNLATIYRIANAINAIRELPELLDTIMSTVMEVFRPDRSALFLLEDASGKMHPKVVRTRKHSDTDDIVVSSTILKMIHSEGDSILSSDAMRDDRFKDRKSIVLHHVHSTMCAPIKFGSDVLGAIYADNNLSMEAFSEDDLQLLSAIGIQAGIAIQNARLNEDIEDLFTGTVKTLMATIEAKCPSTWGHSERVTAYTLATAEEMGLPKHLVETGHKSALLHDIGKIGIPESILNKAGSLTEVEMKIVQDHARRGAEIIHNIKNIEDIVMAVRYHHERYDGKGKPYGLKGEEIPLIAKILAVADAFDAMTHDRPYRKAVSPADAIEEIRRCKGTQFDPEVAEAFILAYRKGRGGTTTWGYTGIQEEG